MLKLGMGTTGDGRHFQSKIILFCKGITELCVSEYCVIVLLVSNTLL